MNQQPNLQQPLVKRFPLIWAVIISVVLTAVIVGGGVYLWQKSQVAQPQQETTNQEQATTQPTTLPEETKIVETSDYKYDINTGNLKSIKDNKVIYTFSDAGKPGKFIGRPAVYIYGLDGNKLILWQTGSDNSPGPGWEHEIWLTDELEYLGLNNLSQGLKPYIVPEWKKQEARELLNQYTKIQETITGILTSTHPQDSEAAYLKMDNGLTLFLVAGNATVDFPLFVGKLIEVKGTMTTQPKAIQKDAVDFGNFVVSEIKEETTWQNFILGREGGFTFQYPSDWVIVPDQSVESPDWQHLKQGAQFLFFIDPEGMAFEYLEKKLSTSNVYLDNVLATKTLFSDESGEVIAAIITFDKNKHSYWFKYEFVAKNSQGKDRYLTILDHIIDTFKFK